MVKNTWWCKTCKFEVFNSKSACSKCNMQKPILTQNVIKGDYYNMVVELDKELNDIRQADWLEARPTCTKCLKDGRVCNKDPFLSVHNCWKYS